MFFLNTEFVSSDLHFGFSCEKRGLQLHVFIRLYLYISLVRVRLVLLYSFRKKVYMVSIELLLLCFSQLKESGRETRRKRQLAPFIW